MKRDSDTAQKTAVIFKRIITCECSCTMCVCIVRIQQVSQILSSYSVAQTFILNQSLICYFRIRCYRASEELPLPRFDCGPTTISRENKSEKR